MGSFFWLTNCDAVGRRKQSVRVAASSKEGYSVAWTFGQTVGDYAACAARHRQPRNQIVPSVAFKKLNSGNTPKRVVKRDHGGGRLILNAKAHSE
jgi:hypothetical protein